MENKKEISTSNRNISLDYLRVIAMCVIVFDHLLFLRHPASKATQMANLLIFNPLCIIQWGGAFGVSIFYLLSGYFFIDSFGHSKNSYLQYSLKTIKSIYFPVVFSFTVFFVFQKTIGTMFPSGCYWWQFSALDWIISGTLIYPFLGSYDKINITWFLIPLLLFRFYFSAIWKIQIKNKTKFIICGGGY